jgi:hypothetical protein
VRSLMAKVESQARGKEIPSELNEKTGGAG